MTAARLSSSPAKWITHAAFLLALIIIIARLTTPDVLRDPWETAPGSDAVPAGAGPAAGLVFDLLASVPAILVLIRRAVDRDYRLGFRPSHLLLFALCIWAVLSTAWSADRFAAAVTAAHFFAACCLLWGMAQLVRSASRFRLVSALSFGLLLVMVVQSMIFRFVDVPENISYFNDKKASILKSHNWAPDSFAAIQLEKKLTSGELVGFFNSPNSFAAVGVLLFFASAGIGLQKLKDGESKEWLILPLIAAISLVWILINARSKTAAASPFVGLAILGLLAVFKAQLRRHRPLLFLCSVGLVVFTFIALIGHGIYHRGLFPGHFSNSLDFRWKYWTASARMFAGHPSIGVGWNNFGLHYLAYRLPEAAEEIKDPHNFLVRFFVELGAVGGALAIAWIVRLAWELTVPRGEPKRPRTEEATLTIRSIVLTVLLGMLLHVVANFDFSIAAGDTLSLLLRPLLFTLALILGTIAGAMLSPREWSLETRTAPWIFYCTVTGLGLFLLHNLIDFSWFEAGAMLPFMAMIGASLGMVSIDNDRPPAPRGLAIGAAAAGAIAWVAIALLFVGPVVVAEQDAASGNEMIRTAPAERSPEAAMHYHNAADAFASAAGLVPYNADYIFREAQAAVSSGDFSRARSRLADARRTDPLLIDAYLLDANLQLAGPDPDVAAVRADFQRIVKLNPNDVTLRVQFGQALDRFGLHAEARSQYQAALDANAALPIGEPKRLSSEKVDELRSKAVER